MKTYIPFDAVSLPFSQLSSEQFEQYCEWLLYKDKELTNVHRIKGNGHYQGGLDICANIAKSFHKLAAYECKCWKKLSIQELDNTIKKFKQNDLIPNIKKYVIILAQEDVPRNIRKKWDQIHYELHGLGIEAELWTGVTLTIKSQPYPDIVSKFFPMAPESQFYNEWMLRTHFISTLHKALIDPVKNNRDAANEFLHFSSLNYSDFDEIYSEDGNWQIKKKWIEISALLPTQSHVGSANITIKTHDSHGVNVILENKWMLENFLGNSGEPISSRYRPFYIGNDLAHSEIIDLQNCRFNLPRETIQQLTEVADNLTKAYLAAIQKVENEWSSHNFPFISWHGQTYIALFTLPKEIWDLMIKFTNIHDVDKGNTEWHIFSASRNFIQLYTGERGKPIEDVYHGMFWAENIEDINDEDELTFLWQPPLSKIPVSEEKWWPCQLSFEWLINEFIPKVIAWNRKKSLFSYFSPTKKIQNIQDLESYGYIRDIRNFSLLKDHHYRTLGILKTINVLQDFYISQKSNRAYFTVNEVEQLYLCLIHLVENAKGYFSYISSKLDFYNEQFSNSKELIIALHKRVKNENFLMSNHEIEHIFRAMCECIYLDESWIDIKLKEDIFLALKPFLKFYDHQLLIDRYSTYM
ncbi:hypothetical protein [Acinetobacter kyonggiensis]|uniref:Restriction endonuclease n=1 Tax=Acinetobacter kyonggiensis TaxID=595670 RepID=A0A1H3JG62_9GAMM|nr:hypothetical protein [Acinetobacter kyonggiensis]SDY38857.1 hypothetical protein SAMN05421643_10947 [Acinetobacter kyonggiensis]